MFNLVKHPIGWNTPKETDWNTLGFIKASRHRLMVLKLLSQSTYTPKELSVKLNTHLSEVTRTLSGLEEKGLVACLTPNLQKGRIYSLTGKGREIFSSYVEGRPK